MAEDSFETVARFTASTPDEVRLELIRAVRRSEPDAREAYGLINGLRFVARKRIGEWEVSLERRAQPWERAVGTRWSR